MANTKIFIEFEPDEVCDFRKKVADSGLTQREFILETLKIPYKKRKLGRPSMDELTRDWNARAAARRAADAELVKQKLKVTGDEHEKLTQVFEKAQRRRRGE